MGVLDNTKFILKVCEMYYHEGLSQKEISAKLGISRPQISRIIAVASEMNLVSIHFNYHNAAENELQHTIKEKFGVEALVFDTENAKNEYQYKLLGERCADYISIEIKDGARVGVMSSRTIQFMTDSISLSKHHGLTFIPLCGGYSINGNEWYANTIAQKLAGKANGKYCVFNAPHVVDNPHSREILMNESNIKQMFDMIRSCDICLVGIGNAFAQSTGSVAIGLNEKELESLSELNAVANICSTYLDEEGNLIDTSVSKRLMGASLNDIRNSRVYGIACGTDKVNSIKAVLKGKAIDVLVTTIDTARELVKE